MDNPENRLTVGEFEQLAEQAHDALQELLHLAQTIETPYAVDGAEELEQALAQLARLCNRFK